MEYGQLDITQFDDFILAPDTGLRNRIGLKMLSWVAPIYDRSLVMQIIFEALGQEWEEIEKWIDDIKAQFFPQTATWSLKYWEDSLGLSRNESSTDAQRRSRVLSKLLQGTNVNPNKLLQTIYNATGVLATYEQTTAPYKFSLYCAPLSTQTRTLIDQIISEMKPAHMSYDIVYQYNKWYNIKTKTWDDLGEMSWGEVKGVPEE